MIKDRPRALFFGSPPFAVPSLVALASFADVVAVVSQPDKPTGRRLETTAPAVKVCAEGLGIDVAQPVKLRTGEFAEWARKQRADVALVVAYGRILPKDVLDAPQFGCVNVHASLLPKYRGAAPIAWAVVRGETETGITLMKLDEGMDTGPTFARIATPIEPEETAGALASRLARIGAEAVSTWLPRYIDGCPLIAQDDAAATFAPMLTKEHGRIDWTAPAARVSDHVRGMNPWPGAFTTARGRTLKVHSARVVEGVRPPAPAGTVVLADKSRVLLACGEGTVELGIVQLEGRKSMPAADWLMGRGVAEGDRLG